LGAAFPARGDCDYTALFCEENVARLLALPALAGLRAWTLLISNPAQSVALLEQRAGQGADGLVIWDYHVLALVDSSGRDDGTAFGRDRGPGGEAGLLAFDLDTRLGFPLPAMAWLEASCPRRAAAPHEARFRLVPSTEYLAGLASDRSHMREADGSWKSPPPPWEAYGRGRANNLMEWIDMERPLPGRVLDRAGLEAFLVEAGAADAGSRIDGWDVRGGAR
jgi:hypothetical protein